MKKIISIFCLILAFLIVGCTSITEMQSGFYVANSDKDNPYLKIDSEDSSFRFGRGLNYSFAVGGTYEIKNGKLIAATGSGDTFIFKIENEKTIVLKEVTDDYFNELINLNFEFTSFQSSN